MLPEVLAILRVFVDPPAVDDEENGEQR